MGDDPPRPDVARLFALAAQAPPASAEFGSTFGDFKLRGLLGQGGMARVFAAVDPSGRDVALKILRKARNPERFLREGQIAAELRHPGILPVHGSGVVRGMPYLVYPLIENARTLSNDLHTATRDQALAWFAEVADALAFAHAKGVVHRDVKPENVLVAEDGRLLLADFGIALTVDLERLTQTGAMVGTPAYMAPEQLRGEKELQGPPADVWSLGVMLYELLVGEPPFECANLALFYSQVHAGAPRIRGGPRAIAALCQRALEHDPAKRPTAAAFRDGLRRFLEAGDTSRWAPGKWAAIAGGCVLLSVSGVVATTHVHTPDALEASVDPGPSAEPKSPSNRKQTPQEPLSPKPLSEDAQATLERAAKLAREGEFAEAEREYRAALSELEPEHEALALEGLASVYVAWVKETKLFSGRVDMPRVELLAPLLPRLSSPTAASVGESLLALPDAATKLSESNRLRLFELARQVLADPRRADLAQTLFLIETNRPQEAQSILASRLSVEPVLPEARALRGALLVRDGHTSEAQIEIARALKEAPTLAEAWTAQALLLEARGELEGALAAIEKAATLRPKHRRILPLHSRMVLLNGDTELALRLAQAAVDLWATSAAWRALAEAQDARGAYANARHAWQRLASHTPKDPLPLARYATALRLDGKLEDARTALADVLERFPDAPSALLEEVRLLEALFDTQQAQEKLLSLVNRRPPFLPALRLFARRTHSWEKGWHSPRAALQASNAILGVAPHDLEAQIIRATALIRLQDWGKARLAASAACAMAPTSAEAASLHGRTLMELNEHEAGLAEFNRALGLKPDDIFLLNRRADAWRLLGRHAAAVEDLQRFVARDGGNYYVLCKLGDSLSRIENPAEAETVFARALEVVGTNDPWHLYHARGLSRERHGDTQGAISDQTEGLKATSDIQRKAQCQAALDRLN